MPDLSIPAAVRPVITVSELNRLAKEALEQNLPLTWVAGEISNLKRYDSGHCYFTLKDALAQVDCVMFRHKLQYLSWLPENGMQVEVRAYPTLYEARGKFQLNVETMRRAGLGALYEAFERLKAKLEKEGLFEAARKRPVPGFPRVAGVVTSLQAAALRDVLTTLRRRLPSLRVVIYPTLVQGEGAGRKIAEMVTLAGVRRECDVLIVCRGGGGIEDLWAYNDEAVARAIVACPIPVITGIGHETDFTIADFVADVRAATPTAAAELVAPDRAKLERQVHYQYECLRRLVGRLIEDRMQRLDYLSRRLLHPGERIRNQGMHLHHLGSRLHASWQHQDEARAWTLKELSRRHGRARPDLKLMAACAGELARRLRASARDRVRLAGKELRAIAAHLKHLNPQLVLERGYSITETASGEFVRNGSGLVIGEDVTITFAKGWASAQVKRKSG